VPTTGETVVYHVPIGEPARAMYDMVCQGASPCLRMHEPGQSRDGFESRAGPQGPGVRLLLHPPWSVNLLGAGFAC
jgi:hypothetical protein